MSVGQQVEASDIEPDGHETQPPARYTEATLVKTLEAKEIGRPSTYASIISTIMDRGYVYERGRALIPSWLAFSVTKLLETNFPKLVDYQFTAEMENGLDRIAHGEESGRDWLTHFYFGSGEGAARNADEAHEGLQQQVAQLGEIDARASTPSTSATACTCASAVTARIWKTWSIWTRRQPEARVSAGHHRAG